MAPKVQYGSPKHALQVQEVQEVQTQIDQFIDSQSTTTSPPEQQEEEGAVQMQRLGVFSSRLVSGVWCILSGVYRLASWCVALAVKRFKCMLFTDQCFGCSAV